jgi:hypothetical protein
VSDFSTSHQSSTIIRQHCARYTSVQYSFGLDGLNIMPRTNLIVNNVCHQPCTILLNCRLRKHFFPFRPFQLNERATAVLNVADKTRSIVLSSDFPPIIPRYATCRKMKMLVTECHICRRDHVTKHCINVKSEHNAYMYSCCPVA